jgi:hypothetical protein
MFIRFRWRAVAALAVFATTTLPLLGLSASGSQATPRATTAATTPRLVGIRAAHHPGFDRVVFEFAGPVPSQRHVRYVSQLIADGSGRRIPIAGRAILSVSLSPAVAHNNAGHPTAPGQIAFALPNVMSVVRSGDFEAVVSHGIGLAKKTSFHVSTLTGPSRVVIDIRTPFATVMKKVYFENPARFAANTPPFVTPVLRPVLPGTPATGVIDRLFAGPTPAEQAAGLRLERSRATGFAALSIQADVARITLTGGCSSGGSTFTIADEIYPSLKQFATVDFVKIYDTAGHTGSPTGERDSIPDCLNP